MALMLKIINMLYSITAWLFFDVTKYRRFISSHAYALYRRQHIIASYIWPLNGYHRRSSVYERFSRRLLRSHQSASRIGTEEIGWRWDVIVQELISHFTLAVSGISVVPRTADKASSLIFPRTHAACSRRFHDTSDGIGNKYWLIVVGIV